MIGELTTLRVFSLVEKTDEERQSDAKEDEKKNLKFNTTITTVHMKTTKADNTVDFKMQHNTRET